jgi:KH domain
LLELKVAASDLGKVIGRQGRTASAIRTILSAAGVKLNRRFTLVIRELALPEARARQARRPREGFVRADPAKTMLVSNPRARPCP